LTHTTETERAKYATMWADPGYRVNSPGFNIAPEVWKLWRRPDSGTFRDYGAGEGKALDWFAEKGLDVDGVDLVKLHPKVREASLWEMGDDIAPTDYAYSADVMEHIPPERVDEVLAAIRARTLVSAAFQIATVPCSQGRKHGLNLHLTVHPRAWWQSKLADHWTEVQHFPTDRNWRDLFICR